MGALAGDVILQPFYAQVSLMVPTPAEGRAPDMMQAWMIHREEVEASAMGVREMAG